MSRSSSRPRSLGLAGFASLAALAVAPTAQAASHTINAQCALPLVGIQPVSVGLDIAASVPVEQSQKLWTVTSFTLPGTLGDGISITASLKASVTQNGGVVGGATSTKFPYPLTAPVDGPKYFFDEPGDARFIASAFTLHVTTRDANGNILIPPPIDGGGEDDNDPTTFDQRCSLPVGGTAPVIGVGGGQSGPTKPGPITFSERTADSVKISWGASTNAVGYRVTLDDETRQVSAAQNFIVWTGIGTGSHDVAVSAIGADGSVTEASTASLVDAPGPVLREPIGLNATNVTPTSVSLAWTQPASSAVVTGYEILSSGTKVAEADASATTATVYGLANGTTYTFSVRARAAGGLSAESAPIQVTTVGLPPLPFAYDLLGTASIKTLVRGSFPVKGGLSLSAAPDGNVSGDLALAPATARLTALGFLPVVAKLAFSASGKTTGTFAAGELKTTSKLRIKVTEAKLFGAIPLAGGNSCQTRDLVTLPLNSEGGWSLPSGGKLTGTFTLSNLNGCGSLNGLVSSATAGKGNTITLYGLGDVPQGPPVQLPPVY